MAKDGKRTPITPMDKNKRVSTSRLRIIPDVGQSVKDQERRGKHDGETPGKHRKS